MPQMMLPLFPQNLTYINNTLSFCRKDGEVYYFYQGPNPIFVHAEADIQTFRMIVSQFYVTGKATQSQICRAFGIPAVTLKRSVKLYRNEGPAGFYKPVVRIRSATVLNSDVINEVEILLANGKDLKEIAEKLEIKYDTLYRAFKAGKIKKKPR